MRTSAVTMTLALLALISSCTNHKDKTSDNLPEYADEPCQDSVSIIKSILDGNADLVNKVAELNSRICRSAKITSILEINEIMVFRDSLMSLLSQDTAFAAYLEKEPMALDQVEGELNRLGIQTLWAEGICTGMSRAPFLEETIQRVGDEPYVLKSEILANVGSTYNGEYRYYSLDDHIVILNLAEKFAAKYPNHPYLKDIMESFIECVTPLTDIHKIVEEDQTSSYVVSGIGREQYPSGTDIESHENFIKEHKDSHFAKTVESIINSMSTLTTPARDTIYIVTVPEPSRDKAVFSSAGMNARLSQLPAPFFTTPNTLPYLWLDVPVAHVLNLPSDDGNYKTVFAYRFFDSKEQAEKSLREIKPLIPEADILHYNVAETSHN